MRIWCFACDKQLPINYNNVSGLTQPSVAELWVTIHPTLLLKTMLHKVMTHDKLAMCKKDISADILASFREHGQVSCSSGFWTSLLWPHHEHSTETINPPNYVQTTGSKCKGLLSQGRNGNSCYTAPASYMVSMCMYTRSHYIHVYRLNSQRC